MIDVKASIEKIAIIWLRVPKVRSTLRVMKFKPFSDLFMVEQLELIEKCIKARINPLLMLGFDMS